MESLTRKKEEHIENCFIQIKRGTSSQNIPTFAFKNNPNAATRTQKNEGLVTLTKRYIHKGKKKKQSSQEILNRQAGMLGGTMFSGLLQQTNSVFETSLPGQAGGL